MSIQPPPGPLGWIEPSLRTQAQQDAHAAATTQLVHFALPPQTLAKGERVCLYDSWKKPEVVADVGFIFTRFRQLTGSCVGVGGGVALFSLIAVQRLLSEGATRAFVPWWGYPYGRSRLLMGDHSQGEGSLGSTFFQALKEDGVFASTEQGLPQFDTSDGLALTSAQEYQWSDGDSPTVTKWSSLAKQHPLQGGAEVKNTEQIKAAILNGYPCTFACNNYVDDATVEGVGDEACVIGYWGGRGGHQQSIHAYWEHPSFGPLFWVQNTWAGNTYPRDPAGGPVCGCWVRENKVEAALRLDAEVYALSHLPWFPAQPRVWDFFI